MRNAIALLVFTAVLVLIMWPSAGFAHRFLVKWGLPAPTPEQTESARRYLRRRRVLYAVCYVLLPAAVVGAAAAAGVSLHPERSWGLLATVLGSLLLAELYAALRPPRGRTRSAVLTPRRWPDVLPRWGLALYLALLGLVVAAAVAALVAHSWAAQVVAGSVVLQPGQETTVTDIHFTAIDASTAHDVLDMSGSWLVLGSALVGLVAVLAVVRLAVVRPAERDPEVDAVLRTRTARVAAGVGIGLALGLLGQANGQVDRLRGLWESNPSGLPPHPWLTGLAARLDGLGMILALFVGLACWLSLVQPGRRAAPAAAPA